MTRASSLLFAPLISFLTCLCTTTWAQTSPQPPTTDAPQITDAPLTNNDVDVDSAIVRRHNIGLGIAFVAVPSGILDHWFVEHGNMWENTANMGFSLDYTLRFSVPCDLRFSLSWTNVRTNDAYWLPRANDDQPQLARYVHNDLSVVALEVAAFHIIPIIDAIDFYYGGGLWGGVLLGNVRAHAVRTTCPHLRDDLHACPDEPGEFPVVGIPTIIGFLSATIGFQFRVWQHMTIQAEGGFKGAFYGRLGMGVDF